MTEQRFPDRPARPRPRAGTVLKVAAAVIVALQVAEQVRYVLRRIRRAESRWWADEEHRELAELHRAELSFLARHVPAPRGSRGGRPGSGRV